LISRKKKLTLPVIYALRNASDTDRKAITNIIKRYNDKPEKVREVIRFVQQSGGIAYAREKMYAYRQEALGLLHGFPASPSRKSLADLIFFVTERQK